MGEIYAKGKVCLDRTKFKSRRRRKREEGDDGGEAMEQLDSGSQECLNLSPGLSGIMAESTDFEERKHVWQVDLRIGD